MTKAEATRSGILQRAFNLIYQKGYQATSIDDILVDSPVTKGAFFYHFKNKEEMGLAMIQEVMYPGMYETMVTPLTNSANPVEELYLMMHNLLLKSPFFQVQYGCPAVNLIEEMAPLNTAFKQALSKLILQWQKAMVTNVNNGKNAGRIKPDTDAEQVACFITAGYSGVRNIGKLLGAACYHTYLRELKKYLDQLQ
ncbi:TetR/AcrR family transcriptional regulator [Mucilaginibacter sp. HC2]|uniref:TetR/AcrR family transcriptional regulator n=1 Tax=Mucilaginibacter inviolabilis TaxID=2714892 RepID=UPI00140D9EA1|nr:TetR/AcrR family transcriptional regulator [Mucilaginibacter inviolabilis]NHA06564.1 TetR/AcrR family transcriptional regulator [Mucilaginibacter inviolabilis]